MKKQGLDVADEIRVGEEAWRLSCGVLSSSLAYIIDTYQSKMDVLDARTRFLVRCLVRIVRESGIVEAENPMGRTAVMGIRKPYSVYKRY